MRFAGNEITGGSNGSARASKRKAEIIDGLAAQMGSRLRRRPRPNSRQRFVRAYFRNVAPEDLAERDPLDLYGAALAQLRSAEERPAGEVKLRVYNPKLEQHGWQSTHTVVEIVNDDMPFLVDSVGIELNRHRSGHPSGDSPGLGGAPRRGRRACRIWACRARSLMGRARASCMLEIDRADATRRC